MQDPPKGPLSSVRRPRALIYVTNRPILICLTLFWVRFCQRFSSIMCFINRRDTLTGDFSVILPASRTKRFKSELLRGWLEEICMVLKFGNFSFCWFQNFSAFEKQFYRNLCRHGQWQYSVHSNQKNWLNMHKYVITSVRTIHIWSTSIPQFYTIRYEYWCRQWISKPGFLLADVLQTRIPFFPSDSRQVDSSWFATKFPPYGTKLCVQTSEQLIVNQRRSLRLKALEKCFQKVHDKFRHYRGLRVGW